MEPMNISAPQQPSETKRSLNIAIVGGGRACKFFLKLLQYEPFPQVDICLKGVCDINPEAQGFQLARQMGIYTTQSYNDFFSFKDLDAIIELTNDDKVFFDLIKRRPKGVGVLEHKIGKLLRTLFVLNQRWKTAMRQVTLEKMSSDFLIQHSNAAIVVLNTDFTISEANDAYLKIVKKKKADVLGRPCYQVYYGLDAPCADARPELHCPMLETLRTGKSAHVIHEFPKSEQLPAYGNIVTYPVKDSDGHIIRVIEIWRDITEAISNHWEERMKTLKDDLNRMVQEDRMISLGKLVASCVHEINNPLQGLLTYSYIAKDILTQDHLQASDIEELKHFADTMTTELERCGNIVSGLLSFSRETPLAYRLIDIGEVVRSVLSLTRHKMELQEIELETRLLSEMILIKGDPNRLQQCLLNLIFNAIEAMPEGGRLCVAERLQGDPRWYEITIADTGCGIEKDQLNHIFDPFYTTKPEGQGTGLGLSIVYGIVKNHQGKLDVESTKGKGTTFRLQFPMQ